MMWRVPWAVSMLRTRHKTFGNLSGYSAAGVDMNNLASWIGSQVAMSTEASICATNRRPLSHHSRASCSALQFDDTLTWADIEWVKSVWGGPMVVKGIMCAQDAVSQRPQSFLLFPHPSSSLCSEYWKVLAVRAGADAIVVSNHGGRQQDGAPASISVPTPPPAPSPLPLV